MKKKYLTLRELRRLKACDKACAAFEKKFGKRATLRATIKWTRAIGESSWEEWLLSQNILLAKAALENGANIHIEDDGALLTMMYFHSDEKTILPHVRFLVERGIDVNVENCDALAYALENSWYQIAEFLVVHGAKLHGWIGSIVFRHVRRNDMKGVRFLLDLMATTKDQQSLVEWLSQAVQRNFVEMVQLLLRRFPHEVPVADRSTLLKEAVNCGYWETAKVLKEYGSFIQ